MEITNDIKYVGVDDLTLDLFESQYSIPNGITYNSYLILDKEICIMDSVDKRYSSEWISNIKKILKDQVPTYLVVQHMEPDHSGSILDLIKEYPSITIVSSSKAFVMMKQFFNNEFEEQRRIVKEGDILNLGNHKLSFIGASMVHWPEVIMTYDLTSKVLFSADSFGTFGISKSTNKWKEEARRYYFGIVGKYGLQVKQVLNKINNLDINIICPLHGPILKDDLSSYLSLYEIWSSYKYEEDSVLIVYCSIYGNSKKAVKELEAMLISRNQKVLSFDLTRDDMSKSISEAFKSYKLILVSSTYNMDIFPYMNTFIRGLVERNYQNRIVGFIENGSWMPNATKVMKNLLSNSKNLTYLNSEVKILSSLDERSRKELMLLVEELLKY